MCKSSLSPASHPNVACLGGKPYCWGGIHDDEDIQNFAFAKKVCYGVVIFFFVVILVSF